MGMEFDDILKDVGGFGRYQKLLLIIFILPPCLAGAFHGFSQIFTVAVPEDYWCRIPKAERLGIGPSRIKPTLPRELIDGKLQHSQCTVHEKTAPIIDNMTDQWSFNYNISLPCPWGWNYDRSVYESTVVMDWDLVCDKAFYPKLSLFIHAIGAVLGTILFGYLTDEIGRKKTFCIAAMTQLLTGVATAFAPNFIVFCIIRFLNGLTIVPVWLIPLIMALEFTGPSKRTLVGTVGALFYTFGLLGLGGLAYLIRNWVHLQLAVTLPFVFIFGYYWWMPESPRWLMSKGRFPEMLVIVRKIAKQNRAGLPEDYFAKLLAMFDHSQTDEQTNKRKNCLIDLFRTANLCKKSCLIIFISFTNSLVCVGLTFFMPLLCGIDHINFIYGAVIQLPAYPVLYFSLTRFGRRVLLMLSLILGGSFLILRALVPDTNYTAVIILLLISKFSITLSCVITNLVAAETFPTVLRGAGSSLTQTVSSIGLCLSPFVAHMGMRHSRWLPPLIFGVLGIVGGMLSLLLPETLGQSLPETLTEAEAFGKGCRTWKNCLKLTGNAESSQVPESGPSHHEVKRLEATRQNGVEVEEDSSLLSLPQVKCYQVKF